jgi:hypothetical protein
VTAKAICTVLVGSLLLGGMPNEGALPCLLEHSRHMVMCACHRRMFAIHLKGGRGHVLLREAEALGDSKARSGSGDSGYACGATREDEVHPGVQCDGCDQFPITGAYKSIPFKACTTE